MLCKMPRCLCFALLDNFDPQSKSAMLLSLGKVDTRVHPIRIRGSSQQLPCAAVKPVSIRPLIGATAKLLSPSSESPL